ncbi:MAG: putative bi-functional transferase/deacetylase [uncultured Truepera sp.]|uniref:Putative bi-functional transferase/deacetylase n=1 Tax=uncultured Truepera sp. TaxID=543023 RepID=A0A6J4VV07_9DEIN|nr:MAG: putative bi-functional transferase/deacetylase [uncultured Truepera sp.]
MNVETRPTQPPTTQTFEDFEFRSVDSAPPRFSVSRSPWLAPVFLVALLGVFVGFAKLSPIVEPGYEALLERLSIGALPDAAFSLRLRPFFLAFFLTFSLFAAGAWWRRLRLLLTLTLLFTLMTFLLDAVVANLSGVFTSPFVSALGDVVLGFAALGAFAFVLLRQATLPEDEQVESERRPSRRYPVRLAFAAVVGGVLAFLANSYLSTPLEVLRDVGFLGGLGPGIILFFPLFITILAVIETLSLRAKTGDIRFSVAFLVPALNEAENITDCIRSLDIAAQRYGRVCRLYLVDNGSEDLTRALAEVELNRCRALDGVVLSCLEPGKSKALNAGLARIKEDIVVRVDADTQVSPNLLAAAIPHFADAGVGAVSGLPLPLETRPLLSKLRAAEVYLNQGFVRLGMSAIDGVLSLSGVFSAYRRSCLDTLGGFAEEINGEDTDIVLRIGRLGYRLVNDPRLHVYSEVPRTFGHLREQRLRWFRSTFHVAARNRSAMATRQGVRGTFSLPWALVQVVRRSVMVPILLFAGVVAVLEPAALHLRGGAALVAVIVGLPFLVSVLVLAAYRRFNLILYLPPYIFFRLLRSYYSLEMLFTLPLGAPKATRLRSAPR